MHEYSKQLASEFANEGIVRGFRAFLADSGTYGFLTNDDGSRVVSFQFNGYDNAISGNYRSDKPFLTGTGWRIDNEAVADRIQDYFDAVPPPWAVRDTQWRFTSLDEHLAFYGPSSRYTEVEAS